MIGGERKPLLPLLDRVSAVACHPPPGATPRALPSI